MILTPSVTIPLEPKMKQIRCIEEFLQALDAVPFIGGHHSHVRVWFRGQPEARLALQPGVYRPQFPVTTEEERIELERHLAQDFRVEAAALLTGRETAAELYFIQQHYRLPTRLLDWTHNPLASCILPSTSQPSMARYSLWMHTK